MISSNALILLCSATYCTINIVSTFIILEVAIRSIICIRIVLMMVVLFFWLSAISSSCSYCWEVGVVFSVVVYYLSSQRFLCVWWREASSQELLLYILSLCYTLLLCCWWLSLGVLLSVSSHRVTVNISLIVLRFGQLHKVSTSFKAFWFYRYLQIWKFWFFVMASKTLKFVHSEAFRHTTHLKIHFTLRPKQDAAYVCSYLVFSPRTIKMYRKSLLVTLMTICVVHLKTNTIQNRISKTLD